MRIHSTFKDYYDGVAAHGQSDVQYVRIPRLKLIDESQYSTHSLYNFQIPHNGAMYSSTRILFCGKCYLFVHKEIVTRKECWSYSGYLPRQSHWVTELVNIDSSVEHCKLHQECMSPVILLTNHSFRTEEHYTKDTCEKLLLKHCGIVNKDEVMSIWDKHRNDKIDPRQYYVVINPKLSLFGFQKYVDAFSAFQQIDSFISSILISDAKPMVEIKNDKIKIEKHGFDNKTSFRKEKSSKKRRNGRG